MKNTNKNMLYTFWSGAILLCLALVAVVQHGLQADERVTGEHALLHGVAQTLFNGRGGAAAGVPGRRKRRLHHRAGVRCERRPGDLNHPAAAKLMIRYHLRRSQRRGEKERAKWA